MFEFFKNFLINLFIFLEIYCPRATLSYTSPEKLTQRKYNFLMKTLNWVEQKVCENIIKHRIKPRNHPTLLLRPSFPQCGQKIAYLDIVSPNDTLLFQLLVEIFLHLSLIRARIWNRSTKEFQFYAKKLIEKKKIPTPRIPNLANTE